MSELLWIGVPQRVRDGRAHLSVMVVPRLAAGSLGDFGMRNWPDVLDGLSLELRTRSGGEVRFAASSPMLVSRPRIDVWHAFFDGDAGLIDQPWGLKTQPSPTVAPVYDDAVHSKEAFRQSARAIAAGNWRTAVDGELARWSGRRSQRGAASEQQSPPQPVRPDFHRAVAMLREHPTVMRALGLVFDVTVDVADLEGGDPSDRAVSITSPDSPVPVTAPWTRYDLDDHLFRPAPRVGSTTLARGGVVDLSTARPVEQIRRRDDGSIPDPPPQWAIATMDVDGAVDSLADAAQAIEEGRALVLPRGRSAGLMLIRPRRQQDLDNVMARASTLPSDSMSEAELTADDLVLGYRVDIRRGGSPWRSLCERDAVFAVRTSGGEHIPLGLRTMEEGHVKPNVAVKGPRDSLHTDEIVVRWDGWSLALPVIDLLGTAPGPRRNPTAELPYDFEWSFDVPRGGDGRPLGRLPELRFGERYRMRVRVADITGGGPGLDDIDTEATASRSVTYTRHEPVEPPTIFCEEQLGPGTSMDVLVISSDPEDEHPPMVRRTLAPPPGTLALAEQHRMFDRAVTDEQAYEWARRAFAAEAVMDPSNALPDPAAEGVFAFAPAEPGGLRKEWEGESDWPQWPDRGVKQIELTAAPAGTPIDLDFVNDRLAVRLPRAEGVTVEISSTIRDDFLDHFAIHGWITGNDAPGSWTDAASRGRHPLLSPVLRLTCVHVVKRPLVVPRWDLPRERVQRSEGETWVRLQPTFPAAGLHTDSTSRLEVAASWTEQSDAGAEEVTIGLLHAETIHRGDPPSPVIRHEFGDTKHRCVSYALTAISRFRHFFPADEPDAAFQRTMTQPDPVNVLSSVRPSAPTVLATSPSFRWDTVEGPSRIERIRDGRLRVEVARPWFETGAGERLAVVVMPPVPVDAGGVAVTQMGRDPIFASDPVPRFPQATWFHGLAGDVATVALPESTTALVVVPYAVVEAPDRWYADVQIAMPPGIASYAPFVQLVVARYQVSSLADVSSASPVAICEPVRLLPHRRLVVERTSDGLRIELSGVAPHPPNRVEGAIDELPPGLDAAEFDLLAVDGGAAIDVPAWRPMPGHSVVGLVGSALPTVTLPTNSGRLRLRVREVEVVAPSATGAGLPEMRERTVFADTIVLPTDWHTTPTA